MCIIPRRSGWRLLGECGRNHAHYTGLSQESLADKAGLHRTHVSLIDRGRRSVRLETLERLAIALHVQPAEMMPAVKLRS